MRMPRRHARQIIQVVTQPVAQHFEYVALYGAIACEASVAVDDEVEGVLGLDGGGGEGGA